MYLPLLSVLVLFLGLPQVEPSTAHYYEIPVQGLVLVDAQLPSPYRYHYSYMNRSNQFLPRVILDSKDEIYFTCTNIQWWGGSDFFTVFQNAKLTFQINSLDPIHGILLVPKSDFSGMEKLKFTIDPKTLQEVTATDFYAAKERYYTMLAQQNTPGGAWFRYQKNLAHRAYNKTSGIASLQNPNLNQQQLSNSSRLMDISDTYDLFTGGRALSENLQLERIMPFSATKEDMVPLDSLRGINIREFDWKQKIGQSKPASDSLSKLIPHDQYAIFFVNFSSMLSFLDELDETGTPILHWLEPRSEDEDIKGFYEKQLCLELSHVARLLGPKFVQSVAFTGSDPFFRDGTDFAMIFVTKDGGSQVFTEYIKSKYQLAQQKEEVKTSQGTLQGVNYEGVNNATRSVSSYLVQIEENVIAVSNSLFQLEQILLTQQQQFASMQQSDEYQFFRLRYPLQDGETAFVMLTDAAIRKWCSPRWRIANSRRMQAAAAMADLIAEQIHNPQNEIGQQYQLLGGGKFQLNQGSIWHSVYGSYEFLIPIAELEFSQVTQQEANNYRIWREGYERNWSNFFDPIALRLSFEEKQIAADLSVVPLILQTEYREFVSLAGQQTLSPGAGDPHGEALAHFVISLDPNSQPVQQFGNFMGMISPELRAKPFQWLGKSLAIYIDQDPIWEKLKQYDDMDDYFRNHAWNLPIGIWVAVENPMALTLFLTAARTYIQQSAPNMTQWESLDYQGNAYVKITAKNGPQEGINIFYATGPNSLLITLNEQLLQRFLLRNRARETEEQANTAQQKLPNWLGQSVSLRVKQQLLDLAESLFREDYQKNMQAVAWASLPILNEWKHLHPNQDPVEFHQQQWGVMLRCPGGGHYVWNEEWQTMESTVYGHPGVPKLGSKFPKSIMEIQQAEFGLTFEEDGLRAALSFTRK